MKILLWIVCVIATHPLKASTFFNHSESEIMHGASQYHQYRSSRFDGTLNSEKSTSEITNVENIDAFQLRNESTSNGLNTFFFHRFHRSSGGLGLKADFNTVNMQRITGAGLFSDEQFNFTDMGSSETEVLNSVTLSPLMSFSMLDFMTLGVELETTYGIMSSSSATDRTLQSQTGIPSVAIHFMGFEAGAVYRPTSRDVYTGIDGDSEFETRIRRHSTSTFFARMSVSMLFTFGGFMEIMNYSDYEGLGGDVDTTPQRRMGGHAELFLNTRSKIEVVASQTEGLQEPTGVLSFESAAKQRISGSLLYRNEAMTSFAFSGSYERMEQRIDLGGGSFADAKGDTLSLSLATQWRM